LTAGRLRDPIKIYRERLLQFGSPEGDRRIEGRVRKVVDDATEACKAAPAARRYHLYRCLCRRRLGMAELTYRDAVARGIAQEMERDDRRRLPRRGRGQGRRRVQGDGRLLEQFGPLRVRDTPISEQAILGAAMGAAMTGLKPIAEIMFSDFFAVCFDYIANEFPEEPLHDERPAQVPAGGAHRQRRGSRFGAQHQPERRELGDDDPGLKVVAPSTPRDVIGCWPAAVRDPDPVIFFEHKSLYPTKGEVPDGEIVDTLGTAAIARRARTRPSWRWR
jgi:pyruvate dehydrogenase E1 component beta subunit